MKETRYGKPPERPFDTPSQDIMPQPADSEAHPEGVIELDSRAEARFFAQMNQQRASVRRDPNRRYTQAPDGLCTEHSMLRSKQSIAQAWVDIQTEAYNHVRDTATVENSQRRASPPRIRAYQYGGVNFRTSRGANLDSIATALAHLWMYRWLSGAYPYNCKLNTEQMNLAQYGAVLMEEDGFASVDKHTGYSEGPAQPIVSCVAGLLRTTMAPEEYAYGREGIARGMGFVTTPPKPLEHMVHSFMSDSDSIDVNSLPHRRWSLSPGMLTTGFGSYYNSSMMYALGSHAESAQHMGDYIAFPPAGWFPSKWWVPGSAWSVSVNPQRYWVAPNASVTVYRTQVDSSRCGCNVQPGRACPLHRRGELLDGPDDKPFMQISTRGFGNAPCVIFRPQGVTCEDGEAYEVLIQGLWAAGERVTLRYIVRFFDLVE
ncbi:hypothetical protein DIPPA_23364 [Diplonema papillatum]|nr:hypothetical protein DIPPA_23364 [Diplonema papillatum]